MKNLLKCIFGTILISTVVNARSQSFYESYLPLHYESGDSGAVNIHFYNNNFIKNNEYFGPYTEGITYIGSILQPEVSWSLSKKFTLSTGWYLRYFYGQESFEKSLPVIRARYTFRPGAQVIIGQLEGQLQHGFIEPIYNTDNYFIKNPEYGVQLLFDRKRLHTDLFMDWEKFLLPGEAHQEVITGGLLSSYLINNFDDNRGLSAHFQSIIHHFGGQVDHSDNPLQSRANIAVGLKYTFIPDLKILTRIILSSFYIQAQELSQTNTIPFNSGFSLENSVTFENKWAKLTTGWFHGEYFFSPLGDYLFQSVSQFNNWYVGEKRDLITSKFLIDHQIMNGVKLGIRLETYYDMQRTNTDFSYGLNISANSKVFHKKTKTNRD